MTKADIVNEIAEKTGIEKMAVQATVEAFMKTIRNSMVEGKNVYLRGFGTFVVKKRAEKIGRSADRVLCLFPMEPPIYAKHGVDARFVGHPLADRFALVSDRVGARDVLNVPQNVPVLAVLPGSRPSELARLGTIFLDAAKRVAQAMPGLRIVIPAANPRVHEQLQKLLGNWGDAQSTPLLLDGHAHEAMLAADVVLLAFGTATLEAMLSERPMVVGYRVSPTSYRIARALNTYVVINLRDTAEQGATTAFTKIRHKFRDSSRR